MVGLGALWLPILVSAVVVFIASSLIHMALKYHATDFSGMPGEAAVAEAMRRQGVGPGNYMIPHCGSHAEARTPENLKRFEDGPVGVFMIAPRGMPNMGRHLIQWFLYTVVIGVLVAYVASRTLAPGTAHGRSDARHTSDDLVTGNARVDRRHYLAPFISNLM